MKWVRLDWIDGHYEISTTGAIRSWAHMHTAKSGKPKVLRENVLPSGYAQIRLPVNGKFTSLLVHRLVLQAFLGTVGEQANHKNGCRSDNRLANLEWCTAGENQKHAYRVLGRVHSRPIKGKTGALNKLSKPVMQLTPKGKVVKVWASLADAARAGFSEGNISAVCRGIRKTHAGCKWAFI